jgi:hypothetical protein
MRPKTEKFAKSFAQRHKNAPNLVTLQLRELILTLSLRGMAAICTKDYPVKKPKYPVKTGANFLNGFFT